MKILVRSDLPVSRRYINILADDGWQGLEAIPKDYILDDDDERGVDGGI